MWNTIGEYVSRNYREPLQQRWSLLIVGWATNDAQIRREEIDGPTR